MYISKFSKSQPPLHCCFLLLTRPFTSVRNDPSPADSFPIGNCCHGSCLRPQRAVFICHLDSSRHPAISVRFQQSWKLQVVLVCVAAGTQISLSILCHHCWYLGIIRLKIQQHHSLHYLNSKNQRKVQKATYILSLASESFDIKVVTVLISQLLRIAKEQQNFFLRKQEISVGKHFF